VLDQRRGLSTQYPVPDGGQLLWSRAGRKFSVTTSLIDFMGFFSAHNILHQKGSFLQPTVIAQQREL